MDQQKCEICDDTGVRNVPNGPDDFDEEFCTCEAGEAARDLADMTDPRE